MFKTRFVYLSVIAILGLVLLGATSPNMGLISLSYGADAVYRISQIFIGLLGIAVLHLGRKALQDYLDLSKAVEKAMENPVGAGLVCVSVSLTMIAIAWIFTGILAAV